MIARPPSFPASEKRSKGQKQQNSHQRDGVKGNNSHRHTPTQHTHPRLLVVHPTPYTPSSIFIVQSQAPKAHCIWSIRTIGTRIGWNLAPCDLYSIFGAYPKSGLERAIMSQRGDCIAVIPTLWLTDSALKHNMRTILGLCTNKRRFTLSWC